MVKLTILTTIFLLFLTALNIKLNNYKLRGEILKLEKKLEHLNIKVENKRLRFEKISSLDGIKALAKKHNVILKELENIEVIRRTNTQTTPIAKNVSKKP